ncbi:MAG TPA: Ig-like domain-containing protein, partial [Ramlibacter sp.]
DTAAPYALSAQVLDRAGDYGSYKTIHLAVRFNEPVMLKSGATPYLSLNNGAQAVYSSISSDGRTLYYNYKISASDTVPTDNQYHWIELKDTGNLASSVTDLAGNALDAAHIQFTTLTNAIDPVPGSGVGIDVTPPAAINTPQLDPATDSGVQGDFITNGSAIFRGTGADAYAEINIYDTSGATPRQVGSSYADQGGNWTFYGYELTDGSYKLAATQLDHAGNESTLSGALPVVIDTFARQPTDLRLDAASDSGALGDMLTSNTTPVLVGSDAEHGAKVELYDGATLLGSAVADATGAWSVKAPALADGSHALSIKMTDIAGNQSLSSSFTLTIDTTAPAKLAKPTLDPSTDSGVPGDWITSYTAPKLTGSGAEAGAKVDVLEGTTVLGSATANSDGSWSLTLSTLAVGTHNLVLHQTDVAGNVSADTTVGLEIVNIVAVAPTTTFFFQPHLVL